jgi:hypothetical protein
MRRDLALKTEQAAFRPFQTKSYGSRLGFRFADGRMKSLPYTQLVETEFLPDSGVILEFVGHRVTLYGRNLTQLYYELESEEVGEIIESHTRDFAVPDGGCFVREIQWERL